MDQETIFKFSGDNRGRKGEKHGKQKTVNGSSGNGRLRLFLMAGMAGAVVYTALLVLEARILERHREPAEAVYTAAVNIPANTHITEDSFDTYFILSDRAAASLPEGCIKETQKGALMDAFVTREYAARDVVTEKGLSKLKDIRESIEDPIELSFGVTNLAQAVGGTIRAGDRINIYSVQEREGGIPKEAGLETGKGEDTEEKAVITERDNQEAEAAKEADPEAGADAGSAEKPEEDTGTNQGTEPAAKGTETGAETGAESVTGTAANADSGSLSAEGTKKGYECVEIFQNAFVTGAYTAAGDEVKNGTGETEAPTTVIKVLIPLSEEKRVNLALENGTVRVSRVCGQP